MKEEYNDIDGLITSYLSGNLDKASFSELQKWTMESEANRIYVRNKLELWFSSGVSGSVEPFDEDAAFTLFQQRAAIFPKKEKYYRKAVHSPKPGSEKVVYTESGVPKNISLSTVYDTARQKQQQNGDLPKILIVEDNDELREYLRNTLSDDYTIQVCSDGKQALDIVKEYMPNMIISDIMMPEMCGDELSKVIKSDITTSHIPIILLTALNTDKNIIEGLQIGADEYIVKPFNIGILRATIANLLVNRAILRRKYANLELDDDENHSDCINCSSDKEWKFIATIKKSVEDNMDNSDFTVDTLAKLLNMSRSSFYSKLKALTDHAAA